MSTSSRVPEGYVSAGDLMSNFDREIEEGLIPRLQAEPVWGEYTAWDFFGKVWWLAAESLWACEVWQYGAPSAVLTAATLQELMEAASAQFGNR